MADFTPPAFNTIIQGSGTHVYSATFFEDVVSTETAIASVKTIGNVNSYVNGWTEPHHRLTSHIGNERVEDGSTITDHVVALPARLTLKGHVSDVTSPNGSQAASEAWTNLKALHEAETIFTIITEWHAYQNMVIRSIDTTQTNRGMEFTMEMQEVVRVGIGSFTPRTRAATAKDRGPTIQSGQRPVGYVGTDADGTQRFFQFRGPGQGYEQLPGRVSTDADGNLQLIPSTTSGTPSTAE